MRCPICRKNFSKKDFLIDHISTKHANEIPNAMTVEQYVYYSIHGTIKGKCMCGCGQDTEWNYKTGKPYKISPDPECRKRVREIALRNGADGMLLKDMEHQKKMQQNRKIAGVYIFADGGKLDYLGKNELAFLTFCEKICEFTSNMVLNAMQVFTYDDNGVERKYMPDFYLPDYNLLVEIKGNNTNPEYMKDTGYKVALKDSIMKHQKKYNYIKIVDNKFGNFLETLYNITVTKNELDENKQFVILETVCNSINEKHDDMFLIIIRDRKCGVLNVAIGDGSALSKIYYVSNENIVCIDDIHDLYNADTSFPDFWKYIGDKDTADRFINIISSNSVSANDQYSHSVMGLINLMHDCGIVSPLDQSSGKCDFINYIL